MQHSLKALAGQAVVCVAMIAGTARADAPPAEVPALPSDVAVAVDAERMIERAIAYLRTQQDEKTGGWSISAEAPNFPAISSLVLTGMLMQPGLDHTDPSIARGVAYVLSNQKPDGAIYESLLPSYNTSISLSMLARVKTPEAASAMQRGVAFLKGLQLSEATVAFDAAGEEAKAVGKDHPFYGGVGYGRHGRPDLSNLQWFLQGLHDAGTPGDDAAFQRAMVFLQRTQMLESVTIKDEDGSEKTMVVNEMPYAKGSRQGGFIYATSENRDAVGSGQSNAPMMEETLSDGTTASRLRCYGSMTYAGFKSYLYANLKKDDPRVTAAMDWIARNYTLDENPGVGTDGLYYYYVTFAKAMEARGEKEIVTIAADGTRATREWSKDLFEKLATLQQEDGSFKSVDDRWMENNPVLITAYALVAMQAALREE
jgi:squalene-hopene/tetraprenyl-beta-curcumene cyclase